MGRNRALRRRRIEMKFAADEEFRIEPTQRHIGIGHRRQAAAVGITGGAGIGAGALRPDFKQTAFIDPSDAAAARADLDEIQRRRRDQPFAGLETGHDARLAVLDDASLGRRPTHVEGDDSQLIGHAPDIRRAKHPRRRPGFDHAHGNAF